ncbi:MAG: hypothetical protein M1274_07850 [Actinobacteria bacterium]|nr:hypothetical protein [Actinomycetota bacterium]
MAPFAPAFVGKKERPFAEAPPFAHRWVLDTAGRQLGIDLDHPDILHTAGYQWDVRAVMWLGMKGVWTHRFYGPAIDEHIAHGVQGVEPDYQVNSMDEVARTVGESLCRWSIGQGGCADGHLR